MSNSADIEETHQTFAIGGEGRGAGHLPRCLLANKSPRSRLELSIARGISWLDCRWDRILQLEALQAASLQIEAFHLARPLKAEFPSLLSSDEFELLKHVGVPEVFPTITDPSSPIAAYVLEITRVITCLQMS